MRQSSHQRTVLITGSALRIGRDIALLLADDGWDIAIHCRRSRKQAEALAEIIRAKKRNACIVQADFADDEDVAAVIPELNAQGIQLDCLINNASLFEKDTLASLTTSELHDHMQVNCFAPLILMRDFAAQYKGKDGNIINITDGMTGWSISPAFLSYSLSKLALAHASQLLALELAPRIRVNAVAPGASLEGVQDKKDTFAKLKKAVPMRHASSPREIGAAIQYILSAPSLTGQTLTLSGGLSLPKNFVI